MESNKIAQAFVNARMSGAILTEYPGIRPDNLDQAYAIQDQALAIWNRTIGGWKVGKINPPLDGQLGANRLAGPIFTDMIVEATAEAANMPVFHGGFAAVEAEFMLRLTPPAPDALPPETNADAMDWISQIRIGVEIASSPYRAINQDGPCVTVSDHGNNKGIVLGAEVPRDQWDHLDDVTVALTIDGAPIGRATTAQMLDGPFGAARFLLANLHARGHQPQDGWWISSGAITGVHEIKPGQSSTASFGKLGQVDILIS